VELAGVNHAHGLAVPEGLTRGPLALLGVEAELEQLQLVGRELRAVGVDCSVLSFARAGDVDGRRRLEREVEDDRLERMWREAAISKKLNEIAKEQAVEL
jgi:hypothetical protein